MKPRAGARGRAAASPDRCASPGTGASPGAACSFRLVDSGPGLPWSLGAAAGGTGEAWEACHSGGFPAEPPETLQEVWGAPGHLSFQIGKNKMKQNCTFLPETKPQRGRGRSPAASPVSL